ncbi:MAG: THUMP domain-containing protein [archaeon]
MNNKNLIAKILIKTAGEISLKSRFVRKKFARLLMKNIIASLENNNIKIHFIDCKTPGRIFLDINLIDEIKTIEILKNIFGIYEFTIAKVFDFEINNLDTLAKKIYENSLELLDSKKTFKIEINRTGKHNYNSVEIISNLLKIIDFEKYTADLKNPEIKIIVEIRDNTAYLYDYFNNITGLCGLPVGIYSKIKHIGEITKDTFYSSFLIMKRGCQICFENNTYPKSLIKFNNYNNFEVCKEDYKEIICYYSSDKTADKASIEKYNYENNNYEKIVLRPLLCFPVEDLKKNR